MGKLKSLGAASNTCYLQVTTTRRTGSARAEGFTGRETPRAAATVLKSPAHFALYKWRPVSFSCV